jgi:cyclopropane fatty-acyl-phospholipid synthase-like methyltransferase
MLWALANDLFQRLVTFDKLEQRKNLDGLLKKMGINPGARVLDFGCGTALFARVFIRRGMEYWGYDIDPRLLAYADRLYPNAHFVSSIQDVESAAPFDLIVANCCFHHIDTKGISSELKRIAGWLAPEGRFLMIDLFEEGPDKSPLRKIFLNMEQGAFFRTPKEIRSLLDEQFSLGSMEVQTCHLLPGSWSANPVASSLLMAECRPKEK